MTLAHCASDVYAVVYEKDFVSENIYMNFREATDLRARRSTTTTWRGRSGCQCRRFGNLA